VVGEGLRGLRWQAMGFRVRLKGAWHTSWDRVNVQRVDSGGKRAGSRQKETGEGRGGGCGFRQVDEMTRAGGVGV